MSPNRLSDDLIWQADGHVSDAALTAIADGEQTLVNDAALSHVNECDHCTTRLGEQALFALSVGEALADAKVAPAPALGPSTLPLPVGAVLAALVLAVLGALPTLAGAARWLPALPAELASGLVVALRAGATLLKVAASGNPAVAVIWLAAAAVLALAGLTIARLAPREMAWKGARK